MRGAFIGVLCGVILGFPGVDMGLRVGLVSGFLVWVFAMRYLIENL